MAQKAENPTLEEIKNIIADHPLKPGYTTVYERNFYGDIRVEIRDEGSLAWRSWNFEAGFLFNLKRELKWASIHTVAQK